MHYHNIVVITARGRRQVGAVTTRCDGHHVITRKGWFWLGHVIIVVVAATVRHIGFPDVGWWCFWFYWLLKNKKKLDKTRKILANFVFWILGFIQIKKRMNLTTLCFLKPVCPKKIDCLLSYDEKSFKSLITLFSKAFSVSIKLMGLAHFLLPSLAPFAGIWFVTWLFCCSCFFSGLVNLANMTDFTSK